MSSVWKRLGWASLFAYLIFPPVALLLLVGYGISWWLAAGLVMAWSLMVLVALQLRRPQPTFLGRVLGTTGWDATDYTQWTRQLVVRPLVVSLAGSVPLVVVFTTALVLGASFVVACAAGFFSLLGGWLIGGWLWIRAEDARAARQVGSDADVS